MMHGDTRTPRAGSTLRAAVVLALLICGGGSALAQSPEAPASPESAAEDVSAGMPPEQLESLVAPIALYPDALLAQTLVASTYPLEIIQLQQWLTKNPDLEGEALTSALEEQPWDPSIKSMAAVPEVVDRLANDIQWTTDLGNAFLAQQEDVLDAAQTMRKKAQQKGSLESNEQMTVETQVVETDTVIIVQSADPEVIYVPVYDPVVVYPPVVYAYPPIYYPPYHPGAPFVAFSIGVAWGNHYGGSCCGCGWGHGGGNNIYINNSNNFNQINHRGGAGQSGNTNWQHNPEHRGAAPYGDKATANKYGGSARGESPSNRASASTRPTTSDRSAGGDRAGSADRPASSDRSGSGSTKPAASDRSGSQASGNRSGSGQASSRDQSRSGGSKGGSGLSGGSQGYNKGSAQASRSRGSASRGSRGGGRGGRR